MATKSFLKNVSLRGKKECQNFIRALERSDESHKQTYPIDEQATARDMDKETIRKMFGAGGEK